MIRVFLFSDQPILAKGLEAVFASSERFQLCGVSSAPADAIERLRALIPEIIVVDLTAEVSLETLAEFREAATQSKMVLWAEHIEPEMAYQAMGLGVRGVMRKNLASDLQMKCLERVRDGELWFEKSLTDTFLSSERVVLTRRESQLVTLLAQGLKNKEIAFTLGISEGTVKVYLSRLFQKVGVKDRFELALFGLKNLSSSPGAVTETDGRGRPPKVPALRSLVLHRNHAKADLEQPGPVTPSGSYGPASRTQILVKH